MAKHRLDEHDEHKWGGPELARRTDSRAPTRHTEPGEDTTTTLPRIPDDTQASG